MGKNQAKVLIGGILLTVMLTSVLIVRDPEAVLKLMNLLKGIFGGDEPSFGSHARLNTSNNQRALEANAIVGQGSIVNFGEYPLALSAKPKIEGGKFNYQETLLSNGANSFNFSIESINKFWFTVDMDACRGIINEQCSGYIKHIGLDAAHEKICLRQAENIGMHLEISPNNLIKLLDGYDASKSCVNMNIKTNDFNLNGLLDVLVLTSIFLSVSLGCLVGVVCCVSNIKSRLEGQCNLNHKKNDAENQSSAIDGNQNTLTLFQKTAESSKGIQAEALSSKIKPTDVPSTTAAESTPLLVPKN